MVETKEGSKSSGSKWVLYTSMTSSQACRINIYIERARSKGVVSGGIQSITRCKPVNFVLELPTSFRGPSSIGRRFRLRHLPRKWNS